jgi:hypothetical protein
VQPACIKILFEENEVGLWGLCLQKKAHTQKKTKKNNMSSSHKSVQKHLCGTTSGLDDHM